MLKDREGKREKSTKLYSRVLLAYWQSTPQREAGRTHLRQETNSHPLGKQRNASFPKSHNFKEMKH